MTRQNPRLLVVDDHKDTCTALARLLARHGYQVHACSSYDSAVELADQQKFDLLVSDIAMPGRNGLDLMRELRKRHGLTGVAVSAYAEEQDVRKAMEAGFSAHVAKPADIADIEAAVQTAIAV